MYSLFVSSLVGDSGSGTFRIDRSRFLEYTNDGISAQLSSLSVEAIDAIKSWPCIVMSEGRGEERAFICKIEDVTFSKGEVAIVTRAIVGQPEIRNEHLWKARTQLDIGEFEFSRNHWAIKSVELKRELDSSGINPGTDFIAGFTPKPLPAPERSVLLKAKAVIGGWGHTQIDDLLLEAGVAGLHAPRGTGSRQDRANTIFRYVFENPHAKTAENSLLSAYLVRKAREVSGEDALVVGATTPRTIENTAPIEAPQPSRRSSNRVFVVHGQNDFAKNAVLRLLGSVGLHGVVLHEQPNMGRHLLTKFIDEAELVTFAVIIMADDDVGGRKGEPLRPRARQNVILELGYFPAHLGQARVCALITPGLETPSDFDGIVYLKMESDGAWQHELIRELEAAKMPIRQ